ncbi:MAG: FAD-dependent oxidoreductase [Clostridiales bacterium]|nr:FAD-dependent oxidoreductase [Clostridiales bacterium]
METKNNRDLNGRSAEVLAEMKLDHGSRISKPPVKKVRNVRNDGKYNHLLAPLQIGTHTLSSRVNCAPMAFCTTVVGNDYGNAAYAPGKYSKLLGPARGGCGMVCVGGLDINGRDAASLPLPLIDMDVYGGEAFEAVSKFAWLIKRSGAVALLELSHAGAMKPNIPGSEIWGPSEGETPDGGHIQAMDEEMMQSVCNDYARAAIYAKEAGFDGVCIHGGHGFLIDEFLSPLFNHRTDEYGGSIENRSKFPLRVLNSIREYTGKDFIIEIRVSGKQGVPGGTTVEEIGRFLQLCEGIIDCAHISSGLYSGLDEKSACSHTIFYEHGYNAELSAYIKTLVNFPVGVVGYIQDPDLVEQMLADNKCDYVVMGRQMIADPEFVNKVREGREDEIRKCLGCQHCLEFPDPEQQVPYDGIMPWLKVSHCEINPESHLNCYPEDMPVPEASRNVVIVGGGIAGMQAALTAAERGHQVTLYEASDRLGGVLNFAEKDVVKGDIAEYKDTMIRMISRRNIRVCLNMPVTPEFLKTSDADVILLAIGAHPVMPPIKGIENASPALDIYQKNITVGKNVVMVGGGLVGCEAGLNLAKQGHNVTVFDMQIRLAHESSYIYRTQLIESMTENGIRMMPNTKCVEIQNNGVIVQREDGTEEFLEADTILYALGMVSNDTSAFDGITSDKKIVKIGDCVTAAKIGEATLSAYNAAMNIL